MAKMPEKSSKNVAQNLKAEAEALFNKGIKISSVFNKLSVGLFMFKKNPDDKMKVAYTCQKCNHIFSGELDLEMPYTVKCEKCEVLIFKQEKTPKKGIKKLAKS